MGNSDSRYDRTSDWKCLVRHIGYLARKYGISLVLIAVGTLITITIRWQALGFRSRDMNEYFLPWCDSIKKVGLARALSEGNIDYNPPYIYVLWFITKLQTDYAVAIKWFSIFCDYSCAVVVAFIVYRLHKSMLRAAVAAFALLLTPTVVFNGALWGQCDMLYTVLLVAALAAFLGKWHRTTVVLFGIAIAVKLQAIFLFPLLGIWVVRKEIRWRALLLLPVTYFICLVPAWIAGCPLLRLMSIYPNQTKRYSELAINSPTIFAWLPEDKLWIGPFGLWFAAGITFIVTVACMYSKERTKPALTIEQAALFSCLVPFVTPHMHERYIFLGDVICVLYALLQPRHLWVAVLVVGASFANYFPFLFTSRPVPMCVSALMLGLACAFLTFDVLRALYPNIYGMGKVELIAAEAGGESHRA